MGIHRRLGAAAVAIFALLGLSPSGAEEQGTSEPDRPRVEYRHYDLRAMREMDRKRREVPPLRFGARLPVRYPSLSPYPGSLFLGGWKYEGAIGYMSAGGLLDAAFDDPLARVNDNYESWELNYFYYPEATFNDGCRGPYLGIGGGMGSWNVVVDTTGGLHGKGDAQVYVARAEFGWRGSWRALEYGVSLGHEWASAYNVIVTDGTSTMITQASVGSDRHFYGSFSIGLRF